MQEAAITKTPTPTAQQRRSETRKNLDRDDVDRILALTGQHKTYTEIGEELGISTVAIASVRQGRHKTMTAEQKSLATRLSKGVMGKPGRKAGSVKAATGKVTTAKKKVAKKKATPSGPRVRVLVSSDIPDSVSLTNNNPSAFTQPSPLSKDEALLLIEHQMTCRRMREEIELLRGYLGVATDMLTSKQRAELIERQGASRSFS